MATRQRIRRFTFLYVVFILAIIVAANLGALPLELISYLPGRDKTGHFLLMGLLSFFVNLSLGLGRVLFGCLGIALVVTLEELSQLYLARRAFELQDLAADFAGIALFGLLAALCLRGRE